MSCNAKENGPKNLRAVVLGESIYDWKIDVFVSAGFFSVRFL